MLLGTLRNKKFVAPIAILLIATFSFSLYLFTTNITPARAAGGVTGTVDNDPGTLEIYLEYDLNDVIDGISWMVNQFTNIFNSDNNSDNGDSECDCGCGVEGCSC